MPDQPDIYVQWKNTHVCLDFQCECSDPDQKYEMHLDHDHLYGGIIRCPRCGICWRLGAPVLERIAPDHADYDPDAPTPELEEWDTINVPRGVVGPGPGTQPVHEPVDIDAMAAELVAGAEAALIAATQNDGRIDCRRCGRRCRTYTPAGGDGSQVRLFNHTRLDGDGPCDSRTDLY